MNTTGRNNIAVEFNAGSNVNGGSNNIDIGSPGVGPGIGNKIHIGQQGTQNATFIAGIYGSLFPNGVQVIASSQGRLGTVTSSARFKEAIKSMDKASESILALQPVSFRYKHDFDPARVKDWEIIADNLHDVGFSLGWSQ